MILAVAIAGILGPSLMNVMIAMAAVWWASYARLIRGMVLSVRQREFVEAARAIGASDIRIMGFHVLRNILGPVVVLATLDMGWIILGISGLNFLGLGAQPPTPEWGAMLNDGRPFLRTAPQLMLYPGVGHFSNSAGFQPSGGWSDEMCWTPLPTGVSKARMEYGFCGIAFTEQPIMGGGMVGKPNRVRRTIRLAKV